MYIDYRMKILIEQVEETERPVIMQVGRCRDVIVSVSLQGVVLTDLTVMLLLLACFTVINSRLVVDKDGVEKLQIEIIKEEAELVNTTVSPYPPCPLIEEQLDLYRVFVRQEDGSEVEELVEVSTRLDVTYDVDKIHNSREPWITAYILIRYKP